MKKSDKYFYLKTAFYIIQTLTIVSKCETYFYTIHIVLK
jgi:hypothetical protein